MVNQFILLCIVSSTATCAEGGPALQSGYVQSDKDSCVGVATGLDFVPSWLHVRTRLAAALYGDSPLRASEAAGLSHLGTLGKSVPQKYRCLLGELSVRLIAQLYHLENSRLPPVHEAPKSATAGESPVSTYTSVNESTLVRDWALTRRVGFARVLDSGWPVFEFMRRIQKYVLVPHHRSFPRPFDDNSCDAMTRPNDWLWIDAYPRDARFMPSGTEAFHLEQAEKDARKDGTQVCSLAYGVYYLVMVAKIIVRPHVSVSFFDDLQDDVIERDQVLGFRDIFIRKAERYTHSLPMVLTSWWPVFPILGQLAATSILYASNHAYVRPFIMGRAESPSVHAQRPAIVEAGAHDGTDSEAYAKAFPNIDIWSFEAHPEVYQNLEVTLRNCGADCRRVHATACALGADDTDGVPFFVNDVVKDGDVWGTDSTSSLFAPNTGGNTKFHKIRSEPIMVRVRRLETFAKESGMENVRFMELDAEGAELDILRGAGPLLRGTHAVKLEIRHPGFTATKGVPLWPEVRAWLVEQGFAHVFDSESDALFVRRDLALL